MSRYITIKAGGIMVWKHFPRERLMDVSTPANIYLDASPNVKVMDHGGSVDAGALEHVPRVIHRSEGEFQIPTGKSLKHAIKNYQAANSLKISDSDAYEDVLRVLNAFIEARNMPAYSSLTLLITRIELGDPLLEKVAEKLANARYHKTIPEEEDFEEYLEKHQNLKVAMANVDEAKSAARLERERERESKAAAARQRKEKAVQKQKKTKEEPKQKPEEEKYVLADGSESLRTFKQDPEVIKNLHKHFD